MLSQTEGAPAAAFPDPEAFYRWLGNRNPIQRLKRRWLLRMLAKRGRPVAPSGEGCGREK